MTRMHSVVMSVNFGGFILFYIVLHKNNRIKLICQTTNARPSNNAIHDFLEYKALFIFHKLLGSLKVLLIVGGKHSLLSVL